MIEAIRLSALGIIVPAMAWLVGETWPDPVVRWLVQGTAAGVGLMSAGLPLVIAAAGRLAAHRRGLLLVTYVWTFWLTVGSILLLTVGYGALISSLLWRLGDVLTDSLFFGILVSQSLWPMIGGAYAAVAMGDAIRLPADPRLPRPMIGATISRAEAPHLWGLVDEVAARLAVAPPDHLVLVPSMQFEAVAGELELPTGSCRGHILVLSLPARHLLTVDELRAIVGHELGHFSDAERRFSARYTAVFDRGRDAWLALQDTSDEGNPLMHLARKPARRLLTFFATSFGRAERGVARQRELALDAMGAAVTSNRVMAIALGKLHAFALPWQLVDTQAVIDVAQGREIVGVRQQFLQVVHSMVSQSFLDRQLAAEDDAEPFDSHPTLATRLAALDVRPDDILSAVLRVPPDQSASDSLETFSAVEESLFTMHVHARVGALTEAIPKSFETPPAD